MGGNQQAWFNDNYLSLLMDSLVNEGFPLPIPQTDEDGRARQAPVVRKPARKRSLTGHRQFTAMEREGLNLIWPTKLRLQRPNHCPIPQSSSPSPFTGAATPFRLQLDRPTTLSLQVLQLKLLKSTRVQFSDIHPTLYVVSP